MNGRRDYAQGRQGSNQQPRYKLTGVLFGGLNPIPFDPELDTPEFACINCWKKGHTRVNCPEEDYGPACHNCGRIWVIMSTCPRCKDAYVIWAARPRRPRGSPPQPAVIGNDAQQVATNQVEAMDIAPPPAEIQETAPLPAVQNQEMAQALPNQVPNSDPVLTQESERVSVVPTFHVTPSVSRCVYIANDLAQLVGRLPDADSDAVTHFFLKRVYEVRTGGFTPYTYPGEEDYFSYKQA